MLGFNVSEALFVRLVGLVKVLGTVMTILDNRPPSGIGEFAPGLFRLREFAPFLAYLAFIGELPLGLIT